MKAQDIKSLTIIGKRWFDKVNGNTYFSALALINGKPVSTIEYEYGYGNQYEHEIFRKLETDNIVEDCEHSASGYSESAYGYCQKRNIPYYALVIDVTRKRDLSFSI